MNEVLTLSGLRPLVDVSLADRAYQAIKTSILHLDLPPGAIITEVGLAAQLGISKTPVRQAIARLQADHLLTPVPGRGHRVAGITQQDILDVWELRLLLEPVAIEQAASCLTAEECDRLESLVDATEEAARADDVRAFMDASRRFHNEINARAENRFLIAALAQLENHLYRIRVALMRAAPARFSLAASFQHTKEHRELVRLFRERRSKQAAALHRSDIEATLAYLRSAEGQRVGQHLAGAARRRQGQQSRARSNADQLDCAPRRDGDQSGGLFVVPEHSARTVDMGLPSTESRAFPTRDQ